jgi:hypothetical protein
MEHSIFRHYDTTSSPYEAEDILKIPEILRKGDFEQKTMEKKRILMNR